MKIKVCGMRDPGNVAQILALQPDYIGFIFVKRSPRYLGCREKNAPTNRGRTKFVGVFADPTIEDVAARIEQHAIDVIQLHGSESAAFCGQLKRAFPQLIIWKALVAGDSNSLAALQRFQRAPAVKDRAPVPEPGIVEGSPVLDRRLHRAGAQGSQQDRP